jgi:hypothetical protein
LKVGRVGVGALKRLAWRQTLEHLSKGQLQLKNLYHIDRRIRLASNFSDFLQNSVPVFLFEGFSLLRTKNKMNYREILLNSWP